MLYGLDKKLEIHPIQKIHSSKSMWDYIEHIYAAGKNSFVYPKGRNISGYFGGRFRQDRRNKGHDPETGKEDAGYRLPWYQSGASSNGLCI